MRVAASFLATALSGSAVYWQTDTLSGAHLVSLRVLAWVLWIGSVILGMREYAESVRAANESAALRNAFPPKVMLPKPDGGMVMLAESKTSIRWTFLEGIDDKLLIEIADDWARGGKFSEKAWNGRLSAPRFRELQDLFLKREILTWKNADHRQGVEWTAVGRGLLRRARVGLPAPLKFKQLVQHE
jgi:hypothetical protein